MNIEEMSVNAIRVLSADAIQKANSGHPGLPLGTAPIAYELFSKHMNYNPQNPEWINRDRFVLSGGHGSMLLYSLFHLFGIGNLSLDEVKNFRQFGSLTPGHPEYGHTVGVEATTGPLGQGMAMAVGMAMAEAHLASVFNKEGYPVVDHYTYVLGGDGCMMEGISSECFSLAGTLGLSKLIVFYDSNNISIEGSTDIAFTEDVVTRFKAFGFQTIEVEDGNDLCAIGKAIEEAKADKTRPSLIKVNTLIGYGCPAKQGKASAHGEPLGVDNVAALKENIGWPCKGDFEVPQEVYDHYKELSANMAKAEDKWNELFAAYVEKYPEMKIVGNAKTFPMMKQFFTIDGLDDRSVVVKEGDTLSLGSHTLQFVMAPMVHWPEVMVTYEQSEKLLFSADGFGKFGALDVEEDWACEARRYYFNIVGKYGAQVQALLKKASALDIKMILPLHGPILKEDLGYYLGLYSTWSSYQPESKGVFVAYASIHGNTAKAAEKLGEMLKENGAEKVVISDLSRSDMAENIEDAFRYDRIVLMASSYDGGVFPVMEDFLMHLKSKNYQNRKIGLVENGSWAPTAARVMKGYVENFKNVTIAEPVVTIRSTLNEASEKALGELAEVMAKGE